MADNWRGYCLIFLSAYLLNITLEDFQGPILFLRHILKSLSSVSNNLVPVFCSILGWIWSLSKKEEREQNFKARTRLHSEMSSKRGSFSVVSKKMVEATAALKWASWTPLNFSSWICLARRASSWIPQQFLWVSGGNFYCRLLLVWTFQHWVWGIGYMPAKSIGHAHQYFHVWYSYKREFKAHEGVQKTTTKRVCSSKHDCETDPTIHTPHLHVHGTT